jgi:hypothetical protein
MNTTSNNSSMSTQTAATSADDLIDQAEVARLLGVGKRAVASWRTKARAQPLPFIRLAGRIRYRRTDVQAFADAGSCMPPAKV